MEEKKIVIDLTKDGGKVAEALKIFEPLDDSVKDIFLEHRIFPIALKDKIYIIFLYVNEYPSAAILHFIETRSGRIAQCFKGSSIEFAKLSTMYLGIMEFEEARLQTISMDINSSEARRAFETVIGGAIEKHASDIHFIYTDVSVLVKVRINGILQELISFPLAKGLAVVRIFMSEAGMRIEDVYKPQSGKVRKLVGGRSYEMRLQTIGEKHEYPYLAVRILPAEEYGQLKELVELGFEESQRDIIKRMIKKEGIVYVIGPTGSGKTTTIYSALELIDESKNIITIEDPPEIKNDRFVQIAIKPERGVTWESALQDILRQDPDVIFIGEIRDTFAARVALEAAITGHLVFTTLHVKNMENIPERLLQFNDEVNINRITIADSAVGFISQRLLKKIYQPTALTMNLPKIVKDELILSGIKEEEIPPVAKFANRFTSNEDISKSFLGYDMGPDGRTAVSEVVYSDEEISETIKHGSAIDLRKLLNSKEAHITMARHSLMKIKNNLIDPNDVIEIL